MTVQQALEERFSCRHFLEREVPEELLRQVLQEAFCSPSCENSQPWKVVVAGPQAMRRIREGYEQCRKQKIRADLDRRFDGRWAQEMKGRIDAYFDGICAHEPRGNLDYTLQKRNLFYAPAMIFLCIDKELPTWSVFDCGIFAQSLMLAATENGLATMPSAVSVSYPQVLHPVLDIPESDRILIGIGIGYPDPDAPVNTFRTDRKSVDEIRFIQ